MINSQLDNLEISGIFLFLKFSKYFKTYFRENFKHICQHRDHYILYIYQLYSFNDTQAMVNLSKLLQKF